MIAIASEQEAQLLPPPIQTTVDFNLAFKIVQGLAKRHGITAETLLDQDRKESLVWLRFLCMFLITEVAGLNQEDAGELMHRDRTTVRHGISRCHDRASVDSKFKADLLAWGRWARNLSTS